MSYQVVSYLELKNDRVSSYIGNMNLDRRQITILAIQKLNLKVEKDPTTNKEVPTHCPFHADKTASMFINTIEGVFNCFSCAQTGSIEKLFKVGITSICLRV